MKAYRNPVMDNARWEGFEHRPGDVFVCTPAKCGTTWMQTIIGHLLWPEGPPAVVATWWALRERPNVLLCHYADMKRDLEGEMRRVAGFLGIEVPADRWPTIVSACTFEGNEGFLFQGTNGRWRDVLTEEELATYRARVEEALSPAAAAWLENGRLASAR